MPEDYYSNPDDDMPSESKDETMDHKEEDYGETALLPKTILAGKEFDVGDEVVLKIVHKYKDEVEVAYAPEKKKEDKGDMGEPEDMEAAQDQLGAMAM